MPQITHDSSVFQQATSHIVHAVVRPPSALRVRRRDVLGFVGDIAWESPTRVDARRMKDTFARDGLLAGAKALGRRLGPEISGGTLTAGSLALHRVTGQGTLHLGRDAGEVVVVRLTDETVSFNKQAQIVAHTDGLTAVLSDDYGKDASVTDGPSHAWTLSGTGEVALASASTPLIVPLQPARPYTVSTDALVALSGGVTLTATDHYETRSTLKAAGDVARFLEPSMDFGKERVWVVAQGTGHLIIQSAP